ncbi:hypothetical protein SSP24_41110 [Streptomyces spinoverrucosus]|uniref:Uncharacterized protein n=1 Tax=Streptomyces spinoverrucosus TaxID=284043 RepID=A0A4Y3VN54_9ACTN|nr:hypothetical protein [Streptomyces spinoverrucosus]GEC06456.1 hypothetical protein SSP24_41110 [Streptomyces spinoverrucosus]GHB87339.1 hypothetical protein GCM10010397_69000 [Streptomyces spinoverrucosus]
MLALRLTRSAHPAVQLRRLLVAAASAGTGLLLLCTLGYALSHPDDPPAALLRLGWCTVPLAATVHFAVAVARTDPGTRPRPGLSAIGLGPARLMAVSATTTALSTALGSMLALLVFLHLRGDITGMPFDGAAAQFLAAGRPLPVPGTLTLLSLVPAAASLSVALVLRPREPSPAPTRGPLRGFGRFGAYGSGAMRETFGAYGRFGAHLRRGPRDDERQPPAAAAEQEPVGPAAGAPSPSAPETSAKHPNPTATLPWSIATLAAGLAVEAYAGNTTATTDMPGGLTSGPVGVLLGWLLTAIALAVAGPGITYVCGRLLQTLRPGALRLLAGRVLMEEASRIGRPLGIVCAVASAAYAMAALQKPDGPTFGPLTTLGALLVGGCTLATLLTTAVEAKHARADTTAALVRLGAPTAMLRAAATVRAAALVAVFAPLTLVVAALAAQPLTR